MGQFGTTAASAGAGRTDRAGDLVAMARLAARPGAVDAILGWLARRTGGLTVLLGVDGRAVAVPPGQPALRPAVRGAVVAAVGDLRRHGTPSAVLDDESGAIHLVRLGTADEQGKSAEPADRAPYLVAVGRADRRGGVLLADAAQILGLCWRLQEAEQDRRRVTSAMAHSREAVLHLLMIGSLAAAQRIAATLGPRLPNLARVLVVECPAHRRQQVADQIESFAQRRAWIVPCPVRSNHLIALVPPGRDDGPLESAGRPARCACLDELIADKVPESRLGASEEVPLRDTAIGYEQAFHALAVARGVPGRYARFDRHADLAPVVGDRGHDWAVEFLRPCLAYVPVRRADPGADELLATLNSWLTFDSGASRHLRIHRNTLATRLRLINGLLGLDLTGVPDQSAAWLALRLHSGCRAPATPPVPGQPVTLDGLLATPEVNVWARSQLRPLEGAGLPAAVETVRAWLRADTRLPATAEALGVSAPAVRKRLIRIEQVLGRSLLHAPSAKHELWLAMRALGPL